MDQFSISQLAQFSGIKPHTIRIWEQRYNALQPKRSEGNTRYYSGHQLRRLLNIVSMSKTKYKVSKLCRMSDQELSALLEEQYLVADERGDYAFFVDRLIGSGVNYDEAEFSRIFSHCLEMFGLEKSYREIIYPVLRRVGIMWSTDNMPPSQEHYISNLIKQKMLTAIDGLPVGSGSPKWVLFLPENEFHEIGLLFSYYMLRKMGERVVYLGTNVPLSSVGDCLEDTGADRVLLFLVHRDIPENLSAFLEELQQTCKEQSVFIASGREFLKGIPDNKSSFTWVHSVDDLEQYLEKENITLEQK